MGRLAELGAMVFASSPTGFEKLIADETEKWGKAPQPDIANFYL
jgi:hypothetical protein